MSELARRRHIQRALLGAVLILVLVLPAGRPVQAQEYAARPGDVLDVLVIGEPDVSRLVTVSQEGTIFLPLIGNVAVSGMSLKQIEDRLVELFRRYLREPKVVVSLRQPSTDKDFVYVLGQVAKPGPYEYRRGWTVAELLSMAGGPTPRAALPRSIVLRRNTAIAVNLEKLLINADASQNHELKPGDVLVVPEINERVLVLGEVQRPGYLDLKEGDRVLDVIMKAGGPNLKSAPENIQIMRAGAALKANLEQFYRTADLQQNPVVAPGDVVLLPETDRRVLVLGEVVKPGRYYLDLRFPTKVLDVISDAGGATQRGNLAAAIVVRQEGDRYTPIPVDVRRVTTGQAGNIVLKPGDVIFVPTSNMSRVQDILKMVLDLVGSIRLFQITFDINP